MKSIIRCVTVLIFLLLMSVPCYPFGFGGGSVGSTPTFTSVTATTFTGALTGDVTGTASGNQPLDSALTSLSSNWYKLQIDTSKQRKCG
jgi:hypothetical protein